MNFSRLPGVRRLPQRASRRSSDVILFDSWRGRYSDNPRAIAAELRRRDLGFEEVWVTGQDPGPLPDSAIQVKPGSLRHLEYMGRAAYVVANNNMPHWFRKRPGCFYLQTWHGTPLKRIAFDIERPAFEGSETHMRRFSRDIASWDQLISPNRFSTEIFRQAFRYSGPIIETGYPRNDLLSSPESAVVRDRTRAQLGLDDSTRAVLYVPTWRDDSMTFDLELDLASFRKAVGDDTVVLIRAHEQVARTVRLEDEDTVRDVSGYSEVSELYLAADVLLTDYSSAMFDFAVTGKPMVFFAYDLRVLP